MSKIVTLGEIMLRLKSPGSERFFQSPSLEAVFGGGEANVAVSLARFGENVSFVTAVPKNPVGMGAVRELKKQGVNTEFVKITEGGRLGIYFLESGAAMRPSSVIYDREDSVFSKCGFEDFDWNGIFDSGDWFHISGITPAISESAGKLAVEAVKKAKESGVKVSLDLNYRKKLWNYGKKASEVMPEIVKYADVLIANEEDIQKSLEISAYGYATPDVDKGQLDCGYYRALADEVMKKFPGLSLVGITLRESCSADKNGWSGVLAGKNNFYTSKKYMIDHIVDRVGGGDAFSAGLIYGLLHCGSEQEALDFAVAASALKHTVPGDFNLVSEDEVFSLLKNGGSGRVQR